MLKTLVGAFKNKDIRKKILYTLMIQSISVAYLVELILVI